MAADTIRACDDSDLEVVLAIINDGARAYGGHVPTDRLHDPYMTLDELRREILAGVRFWGVASGSELDAVMGIQDVGDVTLIRHAYVRTRAQRKGLGARLLSHLRTLSTRPFLIGTWAAAEWAIRFYERHGFQLVTVAEKNRLLRTYWNIPDRQVETSVVLVDERWRGSI